VNKMDLIAELSEDEFNVLTSIFLHSSPPGVPGDKDDIKKDDIPSGEEGWTLDKPDHFYVQGILRSLASKGSIEDDGWRRRGELSKLYEITWKVTELAREQYRVLHGLGQYLSSGGHGGTS
jgi:hypothetical protein